MPSYEECLKLVNPQGLPLEGLSYSEKVFLDFCTLYEKYDQKIKEAIKTW
jgi:hypothetical protein